MAARIVERSEYGHGVPGLVGICEHRWFRHAERQQVRRVPFLPVDQEVQNVWIDHIVCAHFRMSVREEELRRPCAPLPDQAPVHGRRMREDQRAQQPASRLRVVVRMAVRVRYGPVPEEKRWLVGDRDPCRIVGRVRFAGGGCGRLQAGVINRGEPGREEERNGQGQGKDTSVLHVWYSYRPKTRGGTCPKSGQTGLEFWGLRLGAGQQDLCWRARWETTGSILIQMPLVSSTKYGSSPQEGDSCWATFVGSLTIASRFMRAASDMCSTPYTTPRLKTMPGTDMLPATPPGLASAANASPLSLVWFSFGRADRGSLAVLAQIALRRSLRIGQRFHNLVAANLDEGHASYGAVVSFAETVAPTVNGPVTEDSHLLHLERSHWVRDHGPPETHVRVVAFHPLAIRGRLHRFHDAVFGNEVGYHRCVLFLEGVNEAIHDLGRRAGRLEMI